MSQSILVSSSPHYVLKPDAPLSLSLTFMCLFAALLWALSAPGFLNSTIGPAASELIQEQSGVIFARIEIECFRS
jgi:hypothetical protein